MNFSRPLILASSSPRRQFLLSQAGLEFKVVIPDIDESFPPHIDVTRIPAYLAEKKARVFEDQITNEIVLASDTVVILDHTVLNKPADRNDAVNMLSKLSGQTHRVITAVCLLDKHKVDVFADHTDVTFRSLTLAEIAYYVDHFNPLDKAGAYGAQDCLAPGYNPCSQSEVEFLGKIGKPDLVTKSIETNSAKRITIIEKIEGSYFTVMGLPLVEVFTHLNRF